MSSKSSPSLTRRFLRIFPALAIFSCAPAADIVVPPVTVALAPSPAPVISPRFDYPPARRTSDADVLHGVRVPDPYRWLEVDSSETKDWFEAEDARARRELANVSGRAELIGLLKPLYEHPLPRIPRRRGKADFVRKGTSIVRTDAGVESVVYDSSKHADDGSVSRWILSRDGRHAFIELQKNGLDRRKAVVVETQTGRLMERLDGFEGAEVVWAKDGFFYGFSPADVPHAGRFGERTIRFHALGTEQARDREVVPATHDANSTGGLNPVEVTKDGKFVDPEGWLGW